jgi:hypothetical protein
VSYFDRVRSSRSTALTTKKMARKARCRRLWWGFCSDRCWT